MPERANFCSYDATRQGIAELVNPNGFDRKAESMLLAVLPVLGLGHRPRPPVAVAGHLDDGIHRREQA